MDPDPSPDQASFFSDFKDAKKISSFLSYNLPTGITFSLKIYIFF